MITLMLLLLLGLNPSAAYLEQAIEKAKTDATIDGQPYLVDWGVLTNAYEVKNANGLPDGTVAWAAQHIGDGPRANIQTVKDKAKQALIKHFNGIQIKDADLVFDTEFGAMMCYAAVYTPETPVVHNDPNARAPMAKPQAITIAVLNFTDLDPDNNGQLGRMAADLMINAITAPNVSVIDRNNVQELIEAQEFAQLNIAQDGNDIRMGQLLDARYLLTGTIGHVRGGQLLLIGRITDVVTGEIACTAAVQGFPASLDKDVQRLAIELKLRSKGGMPAKPLLLQAPAAPGRVEAIVRAVPRHGPGNMALVLEPNKNLFLEGDTLEFQVQPDRDGFLTMFAVGPTGGVTVLVPNQEVRSVPVTKGEPVVIPTPDMEFRIPVTAPHGLHRVKAIITPEPLIVPGAFNDRREELLKLARDAALGNDQADPLDNPNWTCREVQFMTQAAPAGPE
ncbi:MAG: FlgO family outer membrane protein [Planctomycetota bacterium]|nr:FlgO family outer membrane protein [Planctomycetota bacterium]